MVSVLASHHAGLSGPEESDGFCLGTWTTSVHSSMRPLQQKIHPRLTKAHPTKNSGYKA